MDCEVKTTYKSFVAVVDGFLDNRKEKPSIILWKECFTVIQRKGCRMSLSKCTIFTHLDFFIDNMGYMKRDFIRTSNHWKGGTMEGGIQQ